ncbi:hypothetical protein MFLO_01020 [Listeria floridensis FSL S10-1187]|uniref:SMI1/KNR4 family protein n=2 Tax=Listeria floridensis TaxID=1494962 RepID=A0ABP3B4B1_9LIST|nr:hypothetical protein MFLO_01020 [Listeria floridensis FSL S10-1187]
MDQYGDEIMDGMLIIGDSQEHGFIILGTNEYEGIYYWDDSYVFEESTDEENTFYVNRSFTELVENI